MTGRQGPPPRRNGATRWRKQPGYPGSPHGVGYRPAGQAADVPRDYLARAVIVTLLCFFPTGIAAIVYAWQARTKKDAGNYRGAVKAAKLARLYTIASLVIGLGMYGIAGLAYLALYLAGTSIS
jgi:Interferon-induced transmembrane protein